MHGLPLRRPGLIVIRSSSFTVEECWPGRTIAGFAGNLGAKLAGHAGNPDLKFPRAAMPRRSQNGMRQDSIFPFRNLTRSPPRPILPRSADAGVAEAEVAGCNADGALEHD